MFCASILRPMARWRRASVSRMRRARSLPVSWSNARPAPKAAQRNGRIINLSSGQALGPWGVIGSAPGEFILPTSLALDSMGNVFVADTGNHRVQKLRPDGQPASQWGGLRFPHGIAIDDSDNVYVTDSDGLRKFSPDGDVLAAWTTPGSFGDPYGVAIGPDGLANIIYADNGSTGTHAEFARQASGPLALTNPTSVTCLEATGTPTPQEPKK